MDALEIVGIVGEVLSWIGLLLGLPLLVVVLITRLTEGPMTAIEIVIVHKPDTALARWFAAGDFHERPLSAGELDSLTGRESSDAFVSSRDPSRMRLEAHQPVVRTLWTLGLLLTSVGGCGLLASWLPIVFG